MQPMEASRMHEKPAMMATDETRINNVVAAVGTKQGNL